MAKTVRAPRATGGGGIGEEVIGPIGAEDTRNGQIRPDKLDDHLVRRAVRNAGGEAPMSLIQKTRRPSKRSDGPSRRSASRSTLSTTGARSASPGVSKYLAPRHP